MAETKKTAKKETTEEESQDKVTEGISEESPEEKTKADSKKDKLAALKEKAKALEAGIKTEKKIELKKEKSEDEEEPTNSLVPIEDYLKSSIHLGTRVITPDMKSYVYKRRADGLAVFNTSILDEKLKEGAEYFSQFAPEKIIVVCKREAGWKAVELFSNLTGIKSFTKKYPAGVLTNSNLENFMEADLVLICDPWIDKNALFDCKKIKIPVMSVCDTNNYTAGIKKVIPGNNKSAKSLGMIFYLLSKIYIENRKLNVELPEISKFIEDWNNLIPPK